jgi:acetoin utilization protein AcuC
VEPAAAAFAPDLVVLQAGADAHHADPLTTLGLTVAGHDWLVGRALAMSELLCGGRAVVCGGGGYGWEHVVPRCWALVAGRLAGRELDDALPETWRDLALRASGVVPPHGLREDPYEVPPGVETVLLDATTAVCDEVLTGATVPRPQR